MISANIMYRSFGVGLRRVVELTWVATACTTLAIALGRCLRLWLWDFNDDDDDEMPVDVGPSRPILQPVSTDNDEAQPKAVVLRLLIGGSGTSNPRKVKVTHNY